MLDAAHRLAAALTALRPEHAQSMKIHPLTNDGRSWLLHCERYWPLGDGDLTATWSARPMELTTGMIFGKKVEFPRRTAAFGVDYKYTGQTQQARPMEAAPTSVRDVIAAMQQVDTLTEHNAALVNWYDAKLNEYMGAHSDDERELVPLAPVVSLSWCTPGHFRRFRLTAKKGVTDALLPSFGAAPGVIRVSNGCLVVMGGLCQKTHKHEVKMNSASCPLASRLAHCLFRFANGDSRR